jgi:pyruvate dehydrogenase E1 component beta subunit
MKKTGRLLVVHEAVRKFGVAAELMAVANEEAFLHLEAPPARVTGFDTVVPLPKGEDLYYPTADRIYDAIKKTIEF